MAEPTDHESGPRRSNRNPTLTTKAHDNLQADDEIILTAKRTTKNGKRTATTIGNDGEEPKKKSNAYGDAMLKMMQKGLAQMEDMQKEGKEQQATIQELQRLLLESQPEGTTNGVISPSPNPKSYEGYTIAVVCAMSFKMSAVRYMLDNEHPRLRAKLGDPNAYKLGDLHGHTVALACLPSQQGKGV
ncbi:hypothetical protein ACHAQH_009852 [Verticillium albo-atrum]